MSLTTYFSQGVSEAIILPPARRGETVRAPLVLSTTSGLLAFATDPAPVATLYDGEGVPAVNASDGADILNNAVITDYDTTSAASIEMRVLVDLDPPPAVDTYVLVTAAKVGDQVVQASAILRVD